jgi:hypothetical protein
LNELVRSSDWPVLAVSAAAHGSGRCPNLFI